MGGQRCPEASIYGSLIDITGGKGLLSLTYSILFAAAGRSEPSATVSKAPRYDAGAADLLGGHPLLSAATGACETAAPLPALLCSGTGRGTAKLPPA